MSVIEQRTFQVESQDGLPIRADVCLPAGTDPVPVVVILHGFKGFKDWGMFPPTALLLAEAGFGVVNVNASMNGIGDQPTEFTELDLFAKNTPLREVEDVRRVLDSIEAGDVDSRLDSNRLGVLGHSRGGGAMVLLAAFDRRVKAVVLWASIARFQRFTERAVADWRAAGRLEIPNARTRQIMWMDVSVLDDFETRADDYDLERACAAIQVPTLIVHGEVDEAVPVEEAEQLFDWLGETPKELVKIPKSGHTFGAVHPWAGPAEAWEATVAHSREWFRKVL